MILLRYVMLRFAKLPIFASLAVVGATNPYLLSQPRTVSLCVVDTRPDRAGPYDPPAGPFAIGMYQQLVGRRLKDGSALHLIVFPASLQPDIVPEVQRLNCSWVLQLWYHPWAEDNDARDARFDRLLFTLWNGSTRKVIESGGGLVSLRGPQLTPYGSFREQILKTLNQLR